MALRQPARHGLAMADNEMGGGSEPVAVQLARRGHPAWRWCGPDELDMSGGRLRRAETRHLRRCCGSGGVRYARCSLRLGLRHIRSGRAGQGRLGRCRTCPVLKMAGAVAHLTSPRQGRQMPTVWAGPVLVAAVAGDACLARQARPSGTTDGGPVGAVRPGAARCGVRSKAVGLRARYCWGRVSISSASAPAASV